MTDGDKHISLLKLEEEDKKRRAAEGNRELLYQMLTEFSKRDAERAQALIQMRIAMDLIVVRVDSLRDAVDVDGEQIEKMMHQLTKVQVDSSRLGESVKELDKLVLEVMKSNARITEALTPDTR